MLHILQNRDSVFVYWCVTFFVKFPVCKSSLIKILLVHIQYIVMFMEDVKVYPTNVHMGIWHGGWNCTCVF